MYDLPLSDRELPSPDDVIRAFLAGADGLVYHNPSLHRAFLDVAESDPDSWGLMSGLEPVVGALDFGLAKLVEQGRVDVHTGPDVAWFDVYSGPFEPAETVPPEALFVARGVLERYHAILDELEYVTPPPSDVLRAFFGGADALPYQGDSFARAFYNGAIKNDGVGAWMYRDLEGWVLELDWLLDGHALSTFLTVDEGERIAVHRQQLKGVGTPPPEAVFAARDIMRLYLSEIG
jgi:hypothetical protein